MSRIKVLVLGFFAAYWASVVVLLLAAPQVYDQVAGLQRRQGPAELRDLLVATALFVFLATGVVRGWRWTFWLILAVFLAGLLRVPVAALQLTGHLPAQGPSWYMVLVAVVGLTQFVIALVMLAGYRKSGFWGSP
jgi:hypothetical protein